MAAIAGGTEAELAGPLSHKEANLPGDTPAVSQMRADKPKSRRGRKKGQGRKEEVGKLYNAIIDAKRELKAEEKDFSDTLLIMLKLADKKAPLVRGWSSEYDVQNWEDVYQKTGADGAKLKRLAAPYFSKIKIPSN